MKVPFLDLMLPQQELKTQLLKAIERVLDSGWFILGRECEEFEKSFAKYCGVKHCSGVGNGLDALEILLRSVDIGVGDEVIVPSNTYIATWLAVSATGAKPVPVEPDDNTFNISPENVKKAVNKYTKAILCVHLYGRASPMLELSDIAKDNRLWLFEDSAQSHGTEFLGKRCGALSDGAAFSFYPGKNLGAMGDGGAVTTNHDIINDRVRTLRNYGSRVKYQNIEKGKNSRLDELQSAILCEKLIMLDIWNERRRALAEFYNEQLAGIGDLRLPEIPLDRMEHTWHLYVIRTKKRDELSKFLDEKGISTLIHYPIPPHMSEAYREMKYFPDDFPIAKSLSETVLSLPIGPHLSKSGAEFVVTSIKEFF